MHLSLYHSPLRAILSLPKYDYEILYACNQIRSKREDALAQYRILDSIGSIFGFKLFKFMQASI